MSTAELADALPMGNDIPPSRPTEDVSASSSLLEALLLCLSLEERENLLAAFTDGVIYVNRVPSSNRSIPLKLTRKAQDQLQLAFRELSESAECGNGNCLDSFAHLKADLEAGVRLRYSGPYITPNSVHDKGVSLRIESSQFVVSCRLYPHTNTQRGSLIATHIKRSNAPKVSGISRPLFSVYSWDVFPYDVDVPLSFDTAALQRIAAELSCRLHPDAYGWETRAHLAKLDLLGGVNHVAMKYQYEVLSRNEDHIILGIEGPQDRIREIDLATIFVEGNTGVMPGLGKRKQIESPAQRRRLPILLQRADGEEMLTDTGDNMHVFTCLSDSEVPSSGCLADLGIALQLEKQTQAIASVRDGCWSKTPHMIKLAHLLGPVAFAKLEIPSRQDFLLTFVDSQLTQRQQQAVAKALATPDICLIHGPPGTGKTRVICEIVQQAIARKWTVLLVAPTHIAVDNVLERIGELDDVNGVRCVTQRKMPDLSHFIQQFAYEQRFGSLSHRCLDKIEQHIAHLRRQRIRIDNTIRILKELLSLRSNLVGAQKHREAVREALSSLSHQVRKDFSVAIQKVDAAQDAAHQAHVEAKQNLDIAKSDLEMNRERARCICLDSYSSLDKSRFNAAENEVRRLHEKEVSLAELRHDSARERVTSTDNQVAQLRLRLAEASETLHELDGGRPPQHITAVIEEYVAQLSTKHDSSIGTRSRALQEAQNQHATQQLIRDDLAKRLTAVRVKLRNLSQVEEQPWWKRTGRRVWWESALVNHRKRAEKYSAGLTDVDKALVAWEHRIKSAELSLQKAQEAKARDLDTARSSELARLHETYRLQCRNMTVELDTLGQRLEDERLDYEAARRAEAVAMRIYKNALQSAHESVARQLRNEAANAVKTARRQFGIMTERSLAAYSDLKDTQEAVEMLESQVTEVIRQRGLPLDLQLRQWNTTLEQYQDTIDRREKTAQHFLGFSIPATPAEVETLIKELPSTEPRLNAEQNYLTEWREYVEREGEGLGRRLASYINLICSTTIGIASDEYFGDDAILEQKQFDLLILDEAGKVTEPEFLVAATRAKRWVLLGDHKQLPPYYDRRLDHFFSELNTSRLARGEPQLESTILRESYFERLWRQLEANDAKYARAIEPRREVLDEQRRMHPDLALFVSDVFYDNQYHSPSDPDFVQSKSVDLTHFSHPVTYIEVCPHGQSRSLETNLKDHAARQVLGLSQTTGYANMHEAKQVVRVIESLVDDAAVYREQDELDESNDRVPAIGVISFYAGQVALIRRLIVKNSLIKAEPQGDSDGEFLCRDRIRVMVNSVDSFQGRECPIIILSFTRSNPYKSIGFVDDPNRLNVALSRARKKLILIGDTHTFLKRSQVRLEEIEDCNGAPPTEVERGFFAKLMTYINGYGEFKKVFHVRRAAQ